MIGDALGGSSRILWARNEIWSSGGGVGRGVLGAREEFGSCAESSGSRDRQGSKNLVGMVDDFLESHGG